MEVVFKKSNFLTQNEDIISWKLCFISQNSAGGIWRDRVNYFSFSLKLLKTKYCNYLLKIGTGTQNPDRGNRDCHNRTPARKRERAGAFRNRYDENARSNDYLLSHL